MRRAVSFRLVAMLIGVSPLVIVELFLSQMGWGRPELNEDPFVGLRGVRPLFVLDEAQTAYEIPVARQKFFRPESFAAVKPRGEFRIFCLGGSTVQGRPFAVETSFTTWLELGLNTLDSSRHYEVVNCGGVSYASYRLVPILQEILAGYEPDLVIVYTGHNEFLEDRTYGHIKHRPATLVESHQFVSQFRTFNVLRTGYLRVRGESVEQLMADRPTLGDEVDAVLDYRGGLAEYHWDESWRDGVVAHFESNLRRMVLLCAERGVPIWLVHPVSNLRDCPPFKAELNRDLTDGEQQRVAELWTAARAAYRHDLRSSADLLGEALKIDSRHPGLHYELAKVLDTLGRYDEARSEYLRAKDCDVCPLRILDSMHIAIDRVARHTGTPVVDVRGMFESICRDGIPGSYLMVDHVHPSIRGHQLIAELIYDEFVARRMARAADWKACEGVLAAHLDNLPDAYYLKGQARLEALRNWTRGRVMLERRTD